MDGHEFPKTSAVEGEDQPVVFLRAFQYFMKREKKLPQAMRDLSAAEVRDLKAAFAGSALAMLTV